MLPIWLSLPQSIWVLCWGWLDSCYVSPALSHIPAGPRRCERYCNRQDLKIDSFLTLSFLPGPSHPLPWFQLPSIPVVLSPSCTLQSPRELLKTCPCQACFPDLINSESLGWDPGVRIYQFSSAVRVDNCRLIHPLITLSSNSHLSSECPACSFDVSPCVPLKVPQTYLTKSSS